MKTTSYEIWYDTHKPHYADHTAHVTATNKYQAAEKLREYKARHGITIYIYSVIKGRLT